MSPPPPNHPRDPPQLTRRGEPVWLEPYPDALLEGVVDRSHEPDARYEAREAIALAFVAGLQRVAPRQRAGLVLPHVLAVRAREGGEMLGVTEAAVHATLQRARSALESGPSVGQTELA